MQERDWIDLILSIVDYSVIPEFTHCELVEYRDDTEIIFHCYFDYNITIPIRYNRRTEDITIYSVYLLGNDETYELSYLSSGVMEWGHRIISDYHNEIINKISDALIEEFSGDMD